MKIDREFLYKLEICKSREEIETTLEECDDDDICKMLTEHYYQILKFNSKEIVRNIVNILIYVYRKYCSEN